MRRLRLMLLAGVSALAITACATNRYADVCVDPGCETTNNIVVE